MEYGSEDRISKRATSTSYLVLLFMYIQMWFTKKGDTMATYARILLKDQLGFQIGKKDGEERHNELFDVVSGEFVSIEEWKYTNTEWEEKELVKIVLFDDQIWKIIISTAWTGVARNIVNSFAGEEKLGKIEMGLYKKQGKDGKYYPNIWIKNDWEKLKRKIDLDTQAQLVEEVEFKGKKMRDFSKLEEVLKSEFENINKKSQYHEKEEKAPVTQDDDIPF